MQEKNRSSSQFSQRTERLADVLKVQLGELPDRIGVSPRMFYGYRSGKYDVSDKAWRKLDQAERAAGIAPESEDSPKKRLNQNPPGELPEDRAARMEKKMDRLEAMMEEMLRCMRDHKKI